MILKTERVRAAARVRAAGGQASRAWRESPFAPVKEAAKWLRVGMRVKRWLLVSLFGFAVMVVGIDLMFLLQLSDLGDALNVVVYRSFGVVLTERYLRALTYQVILGLPLALLGLLVFLYGVWNTMASVTSAVMPAHAEPIADVIWRRRQLAQGARIVVIGGGTGLSTMLRGLKEYSSNITAIVTVTDDGGSSGRLQREFNMLPPGDIRNCLVALADAEPLMQRLFQYRFEPSSEGAEASGLTGHSFGNILIAAMLHITGDFEEAIRQSSRVLAIRGRVLPSTLRNVFLRAELDDGTEVEGETSITAAGKRIRRMMLSDPEAEPLDEALEAIRTADAIIIGPGSVYTSVVPNFLVKEVAAEVAASPAVKVYVCNVMTQAGETSRFAASDHVRAVLEQAGESIFDYVLVNVDEPGPALRERYRLSGAEWVRPDIDEIRRLGVRPIPGHLMSETEMVRHDSAKLAEAIVQLINQAPRSGTWSLDRQP